MVWPRSLWSVNGEVGAGVSGVGWKRIKKANTAQKLHMFLACFNVANHEKNEHLSILFGGLVQGAFVRGAI